MPAAGSLTLVTGGARSGKSAWAEQLAAASGLPVLYVATAEALDEEMAARIAEHRRARPESWRTLEAPASVAEALAGASPAPDVVLIDCLTLLVSNLLLRDEPVEPEMRGLLRWRQSSRATVIAVTNEVGLGIVPDNELARRYRDELGKVNQMVAAAADRVVLMVAGIPVPVKG